VILRGLVSELSSNIWWTPFVLDFYKVCEVVFESVWLKARTVHQHLLNVTNLGFSLICYWRMSYIEKFTRRDRETKVYYIFLRVRSLKFKVRGILLQFMWCVESAYLFAYFRALRRLCSAKSIDSPIGLQPTFMGPRDLRLKCDFLTKHCLKVTCGCGMPLLLNTGTKLSSSSFFFLFPQYLYTSVKLVVLLFSVFFYDFVPCDMRF
jgi:hypothetical protein